MPPPRNAARAPNTRFRDFIGRGEAALGMLPFTHVTDAYGLRDIVDGGALTPQMCPVFGEALLYMFYGRPAFRKNMGIEASRNSAYAPVCLIVHPSDTLQPHRMFPFDSGAFDANLLAPLFHKQMQLEDFGLDPVVASAGRVVRAFFEDNGRYFLNTPGPPPPLGRLDFEVSCYADLVQKAEEHAVDERLSTIELQFDKAVSLRDHVTAAVVPETFLDDGPLMARFAELDIEPLPYLYMDRWRPLDCTSAIYTAVRDYYRQTLGAL